MIGLNDYHFPRHRNVRLASLVRHSAHNQAGVEEASDTKFPRAHLFGVPVHLCAFCSIKDLKQSINRKFGKTLSVL